MLVSPGLNRRHQGKLVLSPTRTYAPIIKAILNQVDRKRVNNHPIFKLVDQDAKWIEQRQNDKSIALNYQEYVLVTLRLILAITLITIDASRIQQKR